MCGRFALISDPAELAEQFGAELPARFAPRYNIAPSQALLSVRMEHGERRSALLQWGLLPSWAKDASASRRPINARAETVAEKPSFRAAYRRRRCLVPADGYYEWRSEDGRKQPYFIYRRDRASFAMAALWEYWEQDGSAIETCALLTCAANQIIAPVHHRMPVIIDSTDYSVWLDPAAGSTHVAHLLQASSDETLAYYPVSTRVNLPANDSVECIEEKLVG
jgi:putative SOS response-associated peptidase YedK